MKKRRILFILLLTICPFLLTSCNQNIGSVFDDIQKKIWPNIWVVIAQVIAFVLMCVIIFFVAYKPVKKLLKNRQEYIDKNIKDSKNELDQAKVYKANAEQEIKEAKVEKVKIIEEAREIALANQQKILEETDKAILERKKVAEEEIAAEKVKMEQEIHNEIVKGAIEVSEEILGRELTKKDNDKIIEDYLKGKSQ